MGSNTAQLYTLDAAPQPAGRRRSSWPTPAPDAAETYARYVRPKAATMLRAARLDVAFHSAAGNWLTYDAANQEIRVLDALGGYGSTLFGHNHPALVEALVQSVRAGRPFAAQASVRPAAAELAADLSRRFAALVGVPAVVTYSNSGAEAVEAAWKHSLLDRAVRAKAERARAARMLRQMGERIEQGKVLIGAEFQADFVHHFGRPAPQAWNAIEAALRAAAEEATKAAPLKIATHGAFHGKTGGALSLTHAEHYRAPFVPRDSGVEFVDAFAQGAEDSLRSCVEGACRHYALPFAQDGQLRLADTTACPVAALFYEPIQGEGGIRELPHAFLKAARNLADEYGFALVADEIQTGMGRTGRFFASEHSGTKPDYVTLSKSLGGGLVKVGALLVRRDRYVDDFGLLHTSTFAEDDHSACVASRALALLDEDGLAVRAQAQGERLLRGLQSLCRRYPHAFADARGKGLLLGLELRDLSGSQVPLARALSQQGLLGYLAAGFLFHHGRLRVAPSLSNPHTLRLEPSAYTTADEIEQMLDALETLGRVLCHQDYGALLEYTTLDTRPAAGVAVDSQPYTARDVVFFPSFGSGEQPVRRVAFLGHFVHTDDLPKWEPSLARLTERSRRVLLDRVASVIDPHPILERRIRAANGNLVDFTFVGVTHDSHGIETRMTARDTTSLVDELQRAVDLAEDAGCEVIGLGGYTSIVTRNGKALTTRRATLTTGNSLTAATTLQALIATAQERGIELSKASVGILGAGGNIGRLIARELAPHVKQIVLVGRRGRLQPLEGFATELLAGSSDVSGLVDPANGRGGLAASIRVTDDYAALSSVDLLVSSTNSAGQPLARVDFVHKPRVVCDVAVPPDAPADLEQRFPETRLLMGGLIAVPNAPDFRVPGLPLERGEIYACMAETLTLGLTASLRPARLGALEASSVRTIAHAARKAGLVLAATKRGRSF
ncbi:MAG: aminotransferase class III-fold pyridoxal phosphate-dependent enzyme [Myxococcales bacterium]|nr:aminotransferase class III-fold pyridoxal phosphate-dependent enzyme [Myxococcales bacterium]